MVDQRSMTISGTASELMITLSRDKVSIHLAAMAGGSNTHPEIAYSLASHFSHDEIVKALDQALSDHPFLLESFTAVKLVFIDQPGITLPLQYIQEGRLEDIASRHLRLRAGDYLTYDISAGNTAFSYTIPKHSLAAIREYYASLSYCHLSSLLWNAISDQVYQDNVQSYYLVFGNCLTVLSTKHGRIQFFRQFHVRNASDVLYYCIATNRLLRPLQRYAVVVQDTQRAFEIAEHATFIINGYIHLPDFPSLVARYQP